VINIVDRDGNTPESGFEPTVGPSLVDDINHRKATLPLIYQTMLYLCLKILSYY